MGFQSIRHASNLSTVLLRSPFASKISTANPIPTPTPMTKKTLINSPESDSVSQIHVVSPNSSSKISIRSRKVRKISSIHQPSKSPISICDEEIPINPSFCPINPVKSLSSSDEICIALDYLRRSDPGLVNLLDSCESPKFKSNPPFLALVKSILYQQLATKAAESIYNRFSSLCGGEATVLPGTVLALSAQQLRAIGVSGRKASYLHDLASKFMDGILSDSSILEMDDETLLSALTAVKGIGVWSVHMFMIFTLHRPDVLPVGDLGVRKGVQRFYGLKKLPEPTQMEKLCVKWRPYRTVGAWYMWRLMEAKGVVKNGNSSEEKLQVLS